MSPRSPETTLTLIVCTHERSDDLARCLEAIAALDDHLDVIVVDSASVPPCRDLVAGYGRRIRHLRYVYEPRPGLSVARNRGLSLAAGSIVGFVDDDAAPMPDWARRIVQAFAAHPDAGCVGGTCRADFGGRRPEWLSDRLLAFAGITSFGDQTHEARSSAEWPFGANFAFRASALRAVGGFPTDLGRDGRSLISGEDGAVVAALVHRGWKVWLEPSAIVDHRVGKERLRREYYWRRIWWEGRTHARLRRGWRRPAGLALEAPAYLLRFLATCDLFYLYRSTAETLGHVAEWWSWLPRPHARRARPASRPATPELP